MLKVGICDDECAIAGQMERIILQTCQREEIPVDVDVFFSGNSLEKEILAGTRYDLLYLDIQMENGDGISTAQNIRAVDENVIFIFVSGYDRYMMELFRLDVFAFVKKPIASASFVKTFLEANHKIGNKKFYFSFRYKSEEYKIPCCEILYFESRGRKVCVRIRGGEHYEYNGKLSEVEEQLSKGKIPFLRIHQSYLVNYHLIKSRNKSVVTLVDETKLPISEERKKEFGRQYSILLGGEIDV